MPLAMQAKLLRALETRVVERVGGMIPITVEVRLISATSVDLLAAIDRGLFRSDLLYRLDVIRIEMPPLADRPQDIPLLVEHFCLTAGAPPIRFEKAAMALLMDHPWAGNVRELKNFVERTRAHHPGEVITRDALPRLLRPTGASVVGGSVVGGSATRVTETMNDVLGGTLPPMTLPQLDPGHGVDLRQLIADLEQAYIRAALSACGGTIAGSARLLGLQRTTLIEKMRRLHITPSA